MSARAFARTAAAALALLLAACSAVLSPAERPALVVLLVVDGLPQRQLTACRDQLAPDGLARFLDHGAWYAQAHFGHAFTVTAAGHATLLTGAYPHRTGIVGNQWRDPQTGEAVYNTGDASHQVLGHPTQPLDGTSPRNLKVDTLGDVLRGADPRARVIAVSGKDRGAILTAGRLGTAYMYRASSGRFASSTYYMPQHPAWVEDFNAARPADRWFRASWSPLLPDATCARSLADDQPGFGPRGDGLPMAMGGADQAVPGPAYYASLLRSPFADQLTLEFALAAVRAEQLGQDEVPDILVVSLSGHDYVNHAYSAESRLSHDHLLQVDRQLQDFFRALDAAVGRGRYLAALTADHGFTPAPEVTRARGQEAGRVDWRGALARVNTQLQQTFGVGPLVRLSPDATLLVDRRRLAVHRLELDRVAEAARAALLREPGLAAAYTRRELQDHSRSGAPFFDPILKGWHPQVSGDVAYVLRPGWMGAGGVATHGSPHADDTHVPLLLWGPPWVKAGRMDARVEVVDLAPTLAQLLRLSPPPASEGRVLPLP